MATLLLQSSIGSAAHAIGGPVGALVGRFLPKLLKNPTGSLVGETKVVEGPRVTNLAFLGSTEGAPIPRVYGRVRIGGQLIWATRLVETQTRERSGGSGGKSQVTASISSTASTENVTYSYAANLAVGLCEGEIAFVRRIWADGQEVDRTRFTHRIYTGTADQMPDPLMVAKEGADGSPAYRGLAYIVFENFPLADYGNRIPQFSFEIVKPVAGLARQIRAVNLIPGSSEYAYSVAALMAGQSGISTSENRHQLSGDSDWNASLDALQALCPQLRHVAFVVSWFGADLRAGRCRIVPAVETRDKQISGAAWSVAGRDRNTARLISQIDGKPAYGGTPSDDVVLAALADLKARGLGVLFYPFVMMDVPGFGWRGEIKPEALEASPAVDAEVARFFGEDESPERYRDFILHYAQLCQRAGGVEAFLLGSELRGVTRALGQVNYPAPLALQRLARDVRAIVGPTTKISYSADWSEYGALVRDGGQTLHFPLDALWSAPEIDFIGIDAYFPMSDWRDTPGHADAQLAHSIYDRSYLRDRMAAGETYDWYYADDAAREGQVRTPITDGLGKPWVYRAKDLVQFWSQPHVERAQGLETRRTEFVPCSKPIWLVEAGCPAVGYGSNAPNFFPDTKIAAQALPPFSSGARDDLMQIRALEAVIAHFDPRSPLHRAGDNPLSPSGLRMLDPDRIYLWAWDARPFPAFPMLERLWADAHNWHTGHWLNGRLESAPLDDLVKALVQDMTGLSIEQPEIDALADGYVIDRPLTVRGLVEPLSAFYGFDCLASAGRLRFQGRDRGAIYDLTLDDLVPDEDGAPYILHRAQDSDLPHEVHLAFTSSEWDYRPCSALSRRLEGASRRLAEGEVALVTHHAAAQRAADVWLQDIWVAREQAHFTLRPACVALEVGDLVRLPVDGSLRLFRILRIDGHLTRKVDARAVDLSVYDHTVPRAKENGLAAPVFPGAPHVEILEVALARDDVPALQYVAAFADPWPGALSLYLRRGGGYELAGSLTRCAILGVTLDLVGAGPLGRFDLANVFRVSMRGGALSSASDEDVFNGRNLLGLCGEDGHWELIGFGRAELVGEGIWQISRLLRGLGGEDFLASRQVPAGARAVIVDEALFALATGFEHLGVQRQFRLGPQNRDYADASYVAFEAVPGPLALKPFAPVRAKAVRSVDGITISFLRRSRRNGDNWEGFEIPLGEESEAYLIDIFAGESVRRSLSASAPSVFYSAQDERADFGLAQTRLSLRIAQWSASVGRGFDLRADIPVL